MHQIKFHLYFLLISCKIFFPNVMLLCLLYFVKFPFNININHVPEAEKGLQYSIGYQAISSLSLSTLNEQTYPLSLSHNIALNKEGCVLLLINQIIFTTSTRMFIIVLLIVSWYFCYTNFIWRTMKKTKKVFLYYFSLTSFDHFSRRPCCRKTWAQCNHFGPLLAILWPRLPSFRLIH